MKKRPRTQPVFFCAGSIVVIACVEQLEDEAPMLAKEGHAPPTSRVADGERGPPKRLVMRTTLAA